VCDVAVARGAPRQLALSLDAPLTFAGVTAAASR